MSTEIRISCLQEEDEEAGREGEPEEAEDPFPSATLPFNLNESSVVLTSVLLECKLKVYQRLKVTRV